jgi:putative addiction module CopG family antidote
MNVVLPPTLEEYIASLIKTGVYAKSDEVVADALREHQRRRQGLEVVMTPELERLLDEGLENLDQARTTDELRRAK